MLIFGFGITTDVNSLTFAALDRDKTYESRAYLEELRGSAYFVEAPPITDAHDLQDRLKSGQVTATIEIPVGFGRDVKRGRPPKSAPGSTAPCRFAPRRSVATSTAFA